jgi:hypothetical protein
MLTVDVTEILSAKWIPRATKMPKWRSGWITAFYEKVKNVKADVAAVLV